MTSKEALKILNYVIQNNLELELYNELHSIISNKYKKLEKEIALRRNQMEIARRLNKNKFVSYALEEEPENSPLLKVEE